MRQSSRWFLVGWLCAVAAPGCVAPRGCPACAAPPPPAAAVASAETLPAVKRGDAEALLGTPPPAGRVTPGQFTDPLKTYRGLTPGQCAALAASTANLAGLLQLEAAAGPERAHHPSRARLTQQQIVLLVSLEARNRAAGAALEAYFQLAKAEASDDLVTAGLRTVQDAVRKTEDILKGALRPAVELDVWQRQQFKFQAEQIQTRNQIEQLNDRLRGLLGFAESPNARYFWPQIDAPVPPAVADVEGAVALALARRPELRLLRCLSNDLDAETLEAIRPLLHTVSPLLGNRPAPDHPCLAVLRLLTSTGPVREREVAVRRQQLTELLAERERSAAAEVRQAAHDLNAHRRLAEIARQQAASWKAKVDDLEKRGAGGLASFADIATARLEWYRARADVVAELAAVRAADVRLRQAQSFWGHDGCPAGPEAPPPVLLPDAAEDASAQQLPAGPGLAAPLSLPDAADVQRLPDLVLPAPAPAR